MSDYRLSRIIEFAKDFYRTLDEAHGVSHGERVAKISMLIQKSEGGDPFIVEAGAWLHQFHDNLDYLKNGLKSLELSKIEIERLYHIVEVCRPKKIKNAKSIEAKIVYDADGLECIGPHGNVRELFCNVCSRNIPLTVSIKKTIEVERLFISTMQTNTGKKLAMKLSDVSNIFWDMYSHQEKLDKLIYHLIDH